ncbi:hypothetical protein MLDJOKPK_00266 [Salmonella phage SPAsTU]|nr:hypothetical protein MLDJOKPK_00266 [Salmonella phage SPAsTU]
MVKLLPDFYNAAVRGDDSAVVDILNNAALALNSNTTFKPSDMWCGSLGEWGRFTALESWLDKNVLPLKDYHCLARHTRLPLGSEYVNIQVFNQSNQQQPVYDRCFFCSPCYEAGMKVNRSEAITPAELSERTQKAIIEMFDEGLQPTNTFYRPSTLVEECFSQLFGASVWRIDIATPDVIRTTKWEPLYGEGWNQEIAATLLNLYKSRFNGPVETTVHFYNFEQSPHDNTGKWAIEFRTIVNTQQKHESFWLEANGTIHRVDSSVVARLPDPEMRSVAEPVFLMSAKAVRDAWGGELEDWKYDAIIKWGTENGWNDVIKYGRQLLFIAKPQLL